MTTEHSSDVAAATESGDEEVPMENVTYSQECIEWEDHSDTDLRQFVRSPNMPMTPAALLALSQQNPNSTFASSSRLLRKKLSPKPAAPKTSSSRKTSSSSMTSAKRGGVVKRLERTYSPGKEVDGILGLAASAPEGTDAEAPTQTKSNLVRTATYPPSTSVPGKGRRRKRSKGEGESLPNAATTDGADVSLFAPVTDGMQRHHQQQHARRRPKSADGAPSVTTVAPPRTALKDFSSEFNELLKQLDQPDTDGRSPFRKIRRPLRPVNETEQYERGDNAKEVSNVSASQRMPAEQSSDSAPQRQATKSVSFQPGTCSAPQNQPNRTATSLKSSNATRPQVLGGPGLPVRTSRTPPLLAKPASQRKSTPRSTTPATCASSSPSEFGDDIDFSEEDLRALDAACTIGSDPPEQNSEPPSAPCFAAGHAHPAAESLQQDHFDKIDGSVREGGSVIEGVPHQEDQNGIIDDTKDEFDDFPVSDVDLQAIDQQIAARTAPSSGKEEFDEFPLDGMDFAALDKQIQDRNEAPPKDEFGDFPDAEIDFDALDKIVAERSAIAAAGEIRGVPPVDAPIRNPVNSYFDGHASSAAFSRYKVLRIDNDTLTYTKMLEVSLWSPSMKKEDEKQSIHRLAFLGPSHQDASAAPGEAKPSDGVIALRGEWYHSVVEEGDLVHLCSLKGRYRTDKAALPVVLNTSPPPDSDMEDDLVLIVHPDLLIPPTTISEAISCSRRAVIRSRVGSSGLTSKAALFGTLRHELFAHCMSSNDLSIESARSFVSRIVRESAESLVGCGVKDSEAKSEIIRAMPQIQRFAVDYTSFHNASVLRQMTIDPSGGLGGPMGSKIVGQGGHPDITFLADSVEAVEEPAISPELGLKGYVDVTVSTSSTLHQPSPGFPRSLMGIELKTGHNQNPQNAHMAQLALYTLMMQVRHGAAQDVGDVDSLGAASGGVLLYLNHESYRTIHVSPMLGELRSLIGQRNSVASELRRASRPRGIKLSYESSPPVQDGSTVEREKSDASPSIEILPAPPAALPEVLATSQPCSKCYANRECMLYAAAEKTPTSESAYRRLQKSHGKLLHHFTGRLTEEDLNYFREWDRLVDLEADASTHFISESWLMGSQEQEKATGKCISSLVIDDVASAMRNDPVPGTKRTEESSLVVFRRHNASQLSTPLSRLNFESGTHVVVSMDATLFDLSQVQVQETTNLRRITRPQLHVVRGTVQSIEEATVTIRAAQNESSHLDRLVQKYSKSADVDVDPPGEPLVFRIDKDEVSTGVGTLRQNLINLFTRDVDEVESDLPVTDGSRPSASSSTTTSMSRQLRPNRLAWLREMVVHMKLPSFDRSVCNSMFPAGQSTTFVSLAEEFSQLNVDQRAAVETVFSMQDYALLQGLPGTGKTSTISFVTRLLAAHGKRVLITSYTHAAVDNVMMKLIDKGLAARSNVEPLSQIIRVGRKSSCHANVHAILASTLALELESGAAHATEDSHNDNVSPSADSLVKVMSSARIVGASALTVPRSPLLLGQRFDVVIIDEAGQISQPAILGALMAADSFVLVGDHMQLPPLVVSDIAEKGGFGVSMLKRLADRFPEAVAQLTLQYRMNETICQISNDIVYGGKLQCGNDDVRSRRLNLPAYPRGIQQLLSQQRADTEWLMKIVDPQRPVVFANTDSIKAPGTLSCPTQHVPETHPFIGLERATGKNGRGHVVNYVEASIVRRAIEGLVSCGLALSGIGVICPLRSQLQFLEKNPTFRDWKASGLEISTIDRYQGRDKPVIIISFVRSNANGSAGKLLNDFRRLNVAVSRAKEKLMMVGSYSTLHRGSSVLRPVLEKMNSRNQIEVLPENALL